jgi:enoyl-CoA hydratase/carnithine racemase
LHGYCLGSGVEIACMCDLRVAADDVVFGMPEVGLGLLPAAGGTQLLPRILGPGRAMELLLSGRRFGAEEAVSYGLVSHAVPRAELQSTAQAMLRSALQAPAAVLAAAKRAVGEGADLPLNQALALERRMADSLR